MGVNADKPPLVRGVLVDDLSSPRRIFRLWLGWPSINGPGEFPSNHANSRTGWFHGHHKAAILNFTTVRISLLIPASRGGGGGMICFQCPSCGKTIKATDRVAGKDRKCPGCGGPVHVPLPKQAAFDEDDVLSAIGTAPAPKLVEKTEPEQVEETLLKSTEHTPKKSVKPKTDKPESDEESKPKTAGESKPKPDKEDEKLILIGSAVFLAVVIICAGILVSGPSTSPEQQRHNTPGSESTLDEIFAKPMSERTWEEQRRAEKWAEEDAKRRYGVTADDFR